MEKTIEAVRLRELVSRIQLNKLFLEDMAKDINKEIEKTTDTKRLRKLEIDKRGVDEKLGLVNDLIEWDEMYKSFYERHPEYLKSNAI